MFDYDELMKKKKEACKRFIEEVKNAKTMKKRYFGEDGKPKEEELPVQENVKYILYEALNEFMLDQNTSCPIDGTAMSEEAYKKRDEYSSDCFSFWYDTDRDRLYVKDPTMFIDRDVLLRDVGDILYRISLVCEKDMTLG